MRKLTKKALSLLLCVMLIASAISCALSVSAEEIGKTTITTAKGQVWDIYDAPVDIDLTGSLSTWLGNTSPNGNPMLVAENGVLKAGSGILDHTSAWQEVGPARFKVPGAVKGATVKISFDFAVNTDGITDETIVTKVKNGENLLWPLIKHYSADGNTVKSQPEKWLNINHNGTTFSQEFVIEDPNEFFRIFFRSARTCKDAWEVRNISVTVTVPEVELEYDDLGAASYYGTAAEGFNSTLTSWPCRLKPADSLANLDFEAGFVYWSGRDASAGGGTKPSSSFKLAPEGDNIYLTMKDDGYQANIQSALFKVANASVGDTVAIIYDAKGADATTLRPYLKQDGIRPVEYGEDGLNTTLNPNGNGAIWNPSGGAASTLIKVGSAPTEFITQTEAEGWTTYITSTATLKDPTTMTSSASSDIFLQILIGAPSTVSVGTKLDAAIDNIRIAKVVDGVYTDLATGDVIYDVNDAPEQEGTPAYYGTEKDGFSSDGASWPQPLKPADDIYNLNFEDGFVYWSGRNTGAGGSATLASDSFKLVDDGTNKYITIKDEGYVDTMRSALFNASEYVSVEDELVVMYSAKGADAQKLRVTLYQDHLRGSDYVSYDPVTGKNTTTTSPSPGMVNILVNNEAQRSVYTGVAAPEGWTTYVTHLSSAVNDPLTASSTKICTEDIYLQVVIDAGKSVKAGHKLDAAIDNIVIAKVDNGFYRDILTGEIIGAVVEHPEQENADTLAWLVGLVMAGQSEEGADFNGDGKVNLLDVVVLKKKLADIL